MNSTHRVLAVLGLLLSAGLSCAAELGKPIASVEELRRLRHEAVERPRRIIFNNDGNEPVYLCQDTTPEELLRHRTTPLAGSQVDTIFYCTWSSGFGLFTHGTKVGQVFSTKEGIFSKNLAPEMLAAGTDPLRVMTDFGRAHRMEVFWSFRVNDTHDGGDKGYGPVMFRANRLKQEHPEWLIGRREAKPKFGEWSAVDFTRAEIRDLAFRFVEEVCQNYAVDGVELDFFRHPVYFKRAAMAGTECNDEERALMTDLLRRVRQMTEAEGMKRGQPILIAVRVPDSVEYCRAIGLDLERWLTDGLLDLLVVGGYYRLNDWEYSAKLGHKHGVKVYPSLDESRVRDPAAKMLRTSVEAYRGRALDAWGAGMDGVYLFNSFDPTSPLWRELGSRSVLAPLDRDYFASILGIGNAAGGALPHASFMRIPALNPAAPIALKPGEPTKSAFYAGNVMTSGSPHPGEVVRLRLQFAEPVPASDLTVHLHGKPLATGTTQGNWVEFDVPPSEFGWGRNEVTATLGEKAAPVSWTDLQCTVRFGGAGK
jgi:hypothetical protein